VPKEDKVKSRLFKSPAPSSSRTYPRPRFPHEGQALFTGHGLRFPGSDAFDLGAVSGFAIPGITGDHTILVQKVQVLIRIRDFISVGMLHGK
jgi:hypothetical protein